MEPDQHTAAGAQPTDQRATPPVSMSGPLATPAPAPGKLRQGRGKSAPIGNKYAFKEGLPEPTTASVRIRKHERAAIEAYLRGQGIAEPTEAQVRAWVTSQAKAAIEALPGGKLEGEEEDTEAEEDHRTTKGSKGNKRSVTAERRPADGN